MSVKYVIAIISVVIIAAIALFFVFSGRRNAAKEAATKASVTQLASLPINNVSVSQTTEGTLTGDDTHQSVRITVNASQRTITLLKGFNQTADRSQSYANNQTAFVPFLTALDRMGFTSSKVPAFKSSLGVCPFGNIYRYSYSEDGYAHDLWSTSCSVRDGDFAGKGTQIRRLFEAQITDYSTFMQGVSLR